jgi:hypothetical protein
MERKEKEENSHPFFFEIGKNKIYKVINRQEKKL